MRKNIYVSIFGTSLFLLSTLSAQAEWESVNGRSLPASLVAALGARVF